MMAEINLSKALAAWADDTEGLGDGHRTVSIEPSGDPDQSWILRMSELTEGGDDHADWTTREWMVYGPSISDVVNSAFVGGWIKVAE